GPPSPRGRGRGSRRSAPVRARVRDPDRAGRGARARGDARRPARRDLPRDRRSRPPRALGDTGRAAHPVAPRDLRPRKRSAAHHRLPELAERPRDPGLVLHARFARGVEGDGLQRVSAPHVRGGHGRSGAGLLYESLVQEEVGRISDHDTHVMLASAILGVVSASTASLRAITPASWANTRAASDSGASSTIGRPLSPPSTMRGSIGISPRKSTPRSAAVRWPPPDPKMRYR